MIIDEKHWSVAMPGPGDEPHSLGMCPDGESNPKPVGGQDSSLTTEPPSHSDSSLSDVGFS